jgi:hypothetical protein
MSWHACKDERKEEREWERERSNVGRTSRRESPFSSFSERVLLLCTESNSKDKLPINTNE